MRASDAGDPGENSELWLFPRILEEAVYRAARSTKMSRSYNLMTTALASPVPECDALCSKVIEVLSAIILKLPVERSEPLFAMQTDRMHEALLSLPIK